MRMPELLNALGVPYQTEGHKHCRPGWLNMPCCWCAGNPGLHLGWDLEREHFYCWRCGGHPTVKTLARLSGKSPSQIRQLMREYGGRPRFHFQPKRAPRAKGFRLPSNIGPLQSQHHRYLLSRGFNSKELEREWGLLGTGPISMLDGRDYKNRIIAPIVWDGHTVSFQGRSISTTSGIKYKACPKDRELINHKHILYGKQEHWTETGICVEGITDVWRLGPSAFATFGIEYSIQQVKLMAWNFRRIFVMFDDDPQAVRQAEKLVADLRFAGVEAYRKPVEGDPGGMRQEDAHDLVNRLILK